jgi:chemotaxis signal transduction protein
VLTSVPPTQERPPDARPVADLTIADAGHPPEPVAPTASGPVPDLATADVGHPPEPVAPTTSGPVASNPKAPARPADRRVEEFLGFCLGGEEYCTWIRSVKEIITLAEVTPIPRGPEDIVGLISLRGTIVPLFDLRRRLGLEAQPIGLEGRVIVFALDVGAVGILVDRVTEVISIDPEALEPPPATMSARDAAVVTAMLRFQGRLIGVLHLDRAVGVESPEAVGAAA